MGGGEASEFQYMLVMGLNHRVRRGPSSLLNITLIKPTQT